MPFYRDGFIAPAARRLDPKSAAMLPQPQIEDRDRHRMLLDDRLEAILLLAYGQEAQHALAQASAFDLGLPDLRQIAVLPMIFNPFRTGPKLRCVRDGRRRAGAVDA